jgi:hypothetical protein
MAPLLSFKSRKNTIKNTQTQVPQSSPAFPLEFQMPNVFVIPPEEEQRETPPWCFFDAKNAPTRTTILSTSPDLARIDRVLSEFTVEPPASSQTANLKGTQTSPEISAEEIQEEVEEQITEGLDAEQNHGVPQRVLQGKETGNDSEIVEVIKVRKNAIPGTPAIARSKTFKSRASKAFHSIKTVGKGSFRKAPIHIQGIWGPQSNVSRPQSFIAHSQTTQCHADNVAPQAHKPPTGRRNSIALSQLFNPSASRTMWSDASTVNTLVTDSTLDRHSQNLSPCPIPAENKPAGNECALRPSSPSPSTGQSSRKRFSVLNLQHIFSTHDDGNLPNSPTTPISTPSMSRNTSTTSSTSSPETPFDEELSAFSSYAVVSTPSSPLSVAEFTEHTPPPPLTNFVPFAETTPTPMRTQNSGQLSSKGDISFEMRLDSLHFDTLSFDADIF